MATTKEADRTQNAEAGSVQVAVVLGRRTVQFMTAATDRSVLEASVAKYVAHNAGLQLYPEDAERVHARLANGDHAGGIAAYFATVGKRWDQEWLEVREVRMSGRDPGAEPSPDAG